MPTIDIPNKICPHCGGTVWFYEEKYKRYVCKVKQYEWYKAWRLKNLEKFREKRRNYYHTKVDKVLFYERCRKRVLSDPERERSYKRKYAAKPEAKEKKKAYSKVNVEMHNLSNKKSKAKAVSNLSDTYIKDLICQDTSLSYKDIPKELVEVKRKQLLLKRSVKNLA